jgi:hypothetical protein
MKKLLTLSILLTLVSCAIPERRIIQEKRIREINPVVKDVRDRKMNCMERFHKLGKIHVNQLGTCKFAFKQGE